MPIILPSQLPLRIGPDRREACANEPALLRCRHIAFLSRPYVFCAPVLKGRPIRHWQVVVICPSRELYFWRPQTGAGVCGAAAGLDRTAEPAAAAIGPTLQKALAMLLLAGRSASRLLEGDPSRGRRHQPGYRD
jgi:hypothetical protein